jgi:hypothetical protein
VCYQDAGRLVVVCLEIMVLLFPLVVCTPFDNTRTFFKDNAFGEGKTTYKSGSMDPIKYTLSCANIALQLPEASEAKPEAV